MIIKFRKRLLVSDLPHFEKQHFHAFKEVVRVYPLGFELTSHGKITIFLLWKQVQLCGEKTIHYPSGYSRLHQASCWEYAVGDKIEDVQLGW